MNCRLLGERVKSMTQTLIKATVLDPRYVLEVDDICSSFMIQYDEECILKDLTDIIKKKNAGR